LHVLLFKKRAFEKLIPTCLFAFLASAGNSNGNATGTGALPPFESGEQHATPMRPKPDQPIRLQQAIIIAANVL